MDCHPPWNYPGKNTGVGSHSFLQEIFLTQGLNPGFCIAGIFLTIWATTEAFQLILRHQNFFFITYPIVLQSLSHVRFFAIPWTVAHQASLSFSVSWSLLKLMSIVSWCHPTVFLSAAPFSSCPQCFPASASFLMSQLFASGSQSVGASALASVLPVNIQDWFPWGWTGWISLQSKRLSRVFFNTTV